MSEKTQVLSSDLGRDHLQLYALFLEWLGILSEPGDRETKKRRVLDELDRWYRSSGVRFSRLPRTVERWILRRFASGILDTLGDLLQPTDRKGIPS